MADAKIIIEAISDNTGIKDLSTALGDAQAKLKETRQKLKDAEKAGNLTAKQMQALRAEFNQQKLIVSQLNGELKRTAGQLTQTGKDAGGLKDQLKNMVSDKLGIDLDGLVGKFSSTSAAMLAVASAAAAVSAALVSSARELSSYSNQFIAFAGNAQHAKKIYDEFNEVYRNTNYDEQKVYDMGKAFMSLGMNAKESAALVMECADAAAAVGKGVEFADELAAAFKRLYTGGELTERQLKSLAEAGIDLSSVQDEIREGGEVAFEALKEKLGDYEGGMNRAKQTAEEMEGDIKGNLVEIGRQTAVLVDEFFGFSEALRGFYQWVIDTTAQVIASIKSMISVFHNARAAGDAYAAANKEWEENYGAIWEEKRKDYASEEDWERDRAVAIAEYSNATADVVVENEKRKQEAIEETKELERAQVQSIAKTSGGGGSSSGSGGSGAAPKDTTSKENANNFRELQKSQEQTIKNEQALNVLRLKGKEIAQQMALIGLSDYDRARKEEQQKLENLAAEKEADKVLHDQRMANYKVLGDFLAENPFDGSDKVLKNLETQKQQEAALFAQRQENFQKMIELQEAQNADNSGLTNNDPGANISLETLDGFSAAIDNIKSKWADFAKQIGTDSPQLKMAFNLVMTPFGNMVDSILSGTKSAAEAMKQFAKQIITAALNMLTQWLALTAILAAFGVPSPGTAAAKMVLGDWTKASAKRDGGIVHAVSGGLISGPGSNRSDSIPAMLSAGEFVMNANAVNAIGADNLARMNAAGSTAEDVSGFGGRSVTLNISAVDASGFGDFLARGGLGVIKQALYDDDRAFGATVGVW